MRFHQYFRKNIKFSHAFWKVSEGYAVMPGPVNALSMSCLIRFDKIKLFYSKVVKKLLPGHFYQKIMHIFTFLQKVNLRKCITFW